MPLPGEFNENKIQLFILPVNPLEKYHIVLGDDVCHRVRNFFVSTQALRFYRCYKPMITYLIYFSFKMYNLYFNHGRVN